MLRVALLRSLCLGILLVSCSNTKLLQTVDSKREQFAQTFAKQCVEKEVRNSINKENDSLRFAKPCHCIAKRISAHLPEREMDKFLFEHKITRTLSMSFDKAAYFCVQNSAKPKSLFLFGKKQ